MRRLTIPLLLGLVLAVSPLHGGDDNVDFTQSFKLRHVRPSKLVERLRLIGGGGQQTGEKFQFRAGDDSSTLDVRVPASVGDKFERHRLMMEMEKAVTALDQPVHRIRIYITMIQGDLLSDAEFRTLDQQLRASHLDLKTGTVPKGVVYFATFEDEERNVRHFEKSQGEAFAQTRPEKILGTGNYVADTAEGGRTKLILDFKAESKRPLYQDKREWSISSTVSPLPGNPLIFVAGKLLDPTQDPEKKQPFPGQHELMMYVEAENIEVGG